MQNKSILHVMLTTLVALNSVAQIQSPKGFEPKSDNNIFFTENKGQVHDQYYKTRTDVLYTAETGDLTVHIKNNGISYQLYREEKWDDVKDRLLSGTVLDSTDLTIYRIDLNWINANSISVYTPEEQLSDYTNYYLENCPQGILNVKSYKGVTFRNLYDGIDIHYYEKDKQLKHDYIIAPHVDYKAIKIKVDGARVYLDGEGSLILETPFGKVHEGLPIVYQNGKQLEANWSITNDTIGFDVADYNPDYELIIDPVTRLWGTYYGGSQLDGGYSCSTDSLGNVYLIGTTNSTAGTIIATIGSHQSTFGSGFYDAFIAKFNSSGTRLWATYYGGSGTEFGNSCVAEASGTVYLAGYTSGSATVIPTVGCHQPTYGGGTDDGFLVKFNNNGVRLWGTYYGGSNSDKSSSCTLDNKGHIFIGGTTNSVTNIATIGSHQPTLAGSLSDAFLIKFDTTGVRIWGTYYGGSGTEFGNSCAADSSGNIFLVGVTSTNGGTAIATPGCHQFVFQSTNTFNDTYIVKFDSLGTRLWGTYYGGAGGDRASSCCTDQFGNVYFSGSTMSPDYIASANAHQTNYNSGDLDAFLVKFSGNGVRQWGTYYGGNMVDLAKSCSIDALGNVYLVGSTSTTTGTSIATPGGYQPTFVGGYYDSYLAKFDNNGIRQWGTYYGGVDDDLAYSSCVDPFGNIYFSGETHSSGGTGIASVGSHQPFYGGGGSSSFDAFLVKMAYCNNLSLLADSQVNVSFFGGSDGSASVQPASGGVGNLSYDWTPGTPSGDGSVTVNGLSAGNWTCTVTDSIGCYAQQSFIITEPIPLVLTASNYSNISCFGNADGMASVIPATGGSGVYSYDWSPGNPQGDGTTAISNLSPGIWTCTVTDSEGATTQQVFNISEPTAIQLTAGSSMNVSCNGDVNGTATVNSATGGTSGYSYDWTPGNPTGDGTISVTELSSGLWTCTVTDANGCISSVDFTITEPTELVLNSNNQTNVSCNGGSNGTASVAGAVGGVGGYVYNWSPGNPSGDGTISINSLTQGVWTCTVTDLNGCMDSVSLTVTEPETITYFQNINICSGQTYTIGNNSYSTNGSYMDTLIASNGCDSIVNTQLDVVTINLDINLVGTTLSVNDTIGANYQWLNCDYDTVLSNGSASSIVAPTNGNYSCVITIGNCTDTTICLEVNSVGLNENSAMLNDIEVYPNPTNGLFKVSSPFCSSIYVHNLLGDLIYSSLNCNLNTEVDLSNAAPGVYLVEVINNSQIEFIKVVKQ